MTFGTKLQPSDSGPGTFRFIVGSAVLAVHDAAHDAQRFHEAMEVLIASTWPVLAETKDAQERWDTFLGKVLVDGQGQPLQEGDSIPKAVRYLQLGYIMRELREAGIFGSKKQEVDDAAPFLNEVLKERGGKRKVE